MERKHKRCCFKRSGSICMIREISRVQASSSIECASASSSSSASSSIRSRSLPPTKSVHKLGGKKNSQDEAEEIELPQRCTAGEKRPPKAGFSRVLSTLQNLLLGSKENQSIRRQRKALKQQLALEKKRLGELQLTEQDVRKLIRLYCKHDNLYNPKNNYYGNKEIDEDCYNDMARSFPNLSSDSLRSYVEKLRNLFEREYTIIESARRNYGEIMTPSIPYYNEFLFLVPHLHINFDKSKSKGSLSLRSDLCSREQLVEQCSIDFLKSTSSTMSVLSGRRKPSSDTAKRAKFSSQLEMHQTLEAAESLRKHLSEYAGSASITTMPTMLMVNSKSNKSFCSTGYSQNAEELKSNKSMGEAKSSKSFISSRASAGEKDAPPAAAGTCQQSGAQSSNGAQSSAPPYGCALKPHKPPPPAPVYGCALKGQQNQQPSPATTPPAAAAQPNIQVQFATPSAIIDMTVSNQTSKQSVDTCGCYSNESSGSDKQACNHCKTSDTATQYRDEQRPPCFCDELAPASASASASPGRKDLVLLMPHLSQGCKQPIQPSNCVQVQMLCDMIRTELSNAPDFIYFDAKWRIIEILREVHKRQLVHQKATPQVNGPLKVMQAMQALQGIQCCPPMPQQCKFMPSEPSVATLKGGGSVNGKPTKCRLCVDAKNLKCPYCCRR